MNTDRFLGQFNKQMRKDALGYTIAIGGGIALGLAGCKAMGIIPFSPTPESSENGHEFTPTPESDLYPTHFAWLDGRNEIVQKIMTDYGLSSNDIKGFEISVSGLLSATDVREEKVQFINFIDPNTGLNISAYYDSQNPNGLLNDFETINRGGGLFVERQLIDLNDPNNYHTLLIIPVDAEQKLKLGESTTIEFNPPEWIRAYMPALDPNKNLVVNVPVISELTTTTSLGFIPEFLVVDGSVEGIQIPTSTASPESQLPPEMTEKYLGQFDKWEKGTKKVNGVETDVIYGFNGETKKIIAMNIETDGKMRMTGVSETTVYDKENNPHNIYVYIDPNWNASDPDDDRNPSEKWGRFTVNSETANILFGKPEDPKYPVFWNALAQQKGLSVDKTIDTVMRENEGVINFNVPVGEIKQITSNSKMTELSYPADLDKPIAIRVVFSQADYDRLTEVVKEKRSVVGYDREGEPFGDYRGVFMDTDPNGQITIYNILTTIEVFYGLDPARYDDNHLNGLSAESMSKLTYSLFDLIGDGIRNKGKYYGDAALKAFDANLTTFR